MSYFSDLSAFISKGGVVNWVISALYLIWAAFLLERGIFYRLTSVKIQSFYLELSDSMQSKDFQSLIDKHSNSYIIPLFTAYIGNYNKSSVSLTASLEEAGESFSRRMERGLWVLSELGHIAPLLGLLGTVIGLIQAFAVISESGVSADVSHLASGIWTAMLTTANGLVLALLAFLSYRIFDELLKRRESNMTVLVAKLDNYFSVLREPAFSIGEDENLPAEDSVNEVW